MTIDELVKMGSLTKVTAHRPTNKVITAGNKKYTTVFKEIMSPHSPKRMSGSDCQCNSICVVEAMREKGENDWHIVPGFAKQSEESDPIAHVWVRKEDMHYDPTWSLPCFNWGFEALEHYQLVQHLDVEPRNLEKDSLQKTVKWGNDIRQKLIDLAANWNLRLVGQLD